MLSKDKTHKVLKTISKRHLTSDEINKICQNSYTNLRQFLTKHLIQYAVETEDQGPQEPFKISVAGLDYLISKEEETKAFRKNFFTNFISGFVLGILTTVISAYLIGILGL